VPRKLADPPARLRGKEFEDIIVTRLWTLKRERKAAIGRYGVMANVLGRDASGNAIAQLMPSLPDFEGVFGSNARQVTFDAKVCSSASWILSAYRDRGCKQRQLSHLYERAAFGAVTFFLLHWNRRELKTKTDAQVTFAVPVHEDILFWKAFEAGSEKQLTRTHCEDFGVPVPWSTFGQEKNPRPDIQLAIELVAERLDRHGRGRSTAWGRKSSIP